ncbi:SDR family NAD(P)-dependent oxidoreductase [Maricaulis parjimensis]|uniref:SDR family NAD(P)-dependent oxidoreductase n=1 Tax=Maricaulis parjimensis TaxID=144023 RepID=UPI001939D797|nr:SDR family NAD(P)-dependent oxidoreductase [Maricaulis parjimensis]
MSAPGRLAGKTAIVVGAGQTPGETPGNGRAIAERFAREGAKVLCVDRLIERAEDTASLIRDAGGEALTLEANIAKSEDCTRIAQTALDAWGRIDILVNNVGIGGNGDGPSHTLTEAAFDRIMTVNLKGMWMTIAAVLPAMRDQRSGAIVNISSLASIAGGFQAAYEMSKAGVNRLTTSTAMANAGRNIRCNAIAPGYMDTPMAIEGIARARNIPVEDLRAERNARVPLSKQMGTAEDTANAALFLASDEARFITGEILRLDGGAGARIG